MKASEARDQGLSSEKGRVLRVALAENQNAGKTSLFIAITGAHHKLGNYPGVTVEKREGSTARGNRTYRFIDLAGIYGLTAYSIDEVTARDFLIDERPDLIVDVIDSTNLERNLYLCTRFQELGIPVVGALNMSDEAAANGITIDDESLSALLGIMMVRTVDANGKGIEGLLDAIDATVKKPRDELKSIHYGEELESRIVPLETVIRADSDFISRYSARWLAVKLFEKNANAFCAPRRAFGGKSHRRAGSLGIELARKTFWQRCRRYRSRAALWLYPWCGERIAENKENHELLAYRIPRYHYPEPIFRFAHFHPDPLGCLPANLHLGLLSPGLAGNFLRLVWRRGHAVHIRRIASLGRGGRYHGRRGKCFLVCSADHHPVFPSLPAWGCRLHVPGAFACDKSLHSFGSPWSIDFPLMLGFGCSVPASMAARTLKSKRDRIVTILVIPFMSCGTKMPVYALLAGAFFQDNPGNMVMLMYALGDILSLLAASVLKKTVLKGAPPPFVMELPPYRAPALRGVEWYVREKTFSHRKKMETAIMAASILVWAITTFPLYEMATQALDQAKIAYVAAGEAMAHSAAGVIGKAIEPVLRRRKSLSPRWVSAIERPMPVEMFRSGKLCETILIGLPYWRSYS